MSLRKLHETGRTLLETISVLVVIAILIIASLLGYDALREYLKRKETVKQVTELSVRYKLQPVKPPRGKNNPRIKLIYPEANTKDGITIELPEEKARVSLLVFENACISYFLEPIEGLSKATCLEILNQNQYGGIKIGDKVRARESLTDEDLVEKGLCQSEMNSLTLVHSSTTGGSLNGYWYGDCYHHCQEGIPEDIYGNCCETQAQVDSYNKCGVCVCPDNGECCSNKLYCDETFFGECVGCMTDSHCKDDLICDPSTHRCVECYNDTHCRGKGADYKCDLSTNRCVKCKTGNGVSWNADLGICACTISLGNGLPCYSDNNCCSSGLCHNFGGIKGFRCVECLEQKDCRGNLVCLSDKNCGCPSGQTAYRDRDNKPACCVTNRLYDNNKKCCDRDLVNGVCPSATQCVFNNTIYDNGALIDFCNKCVNGEIRATNEGGLVGNCGKCNNGSVVADTTQYNSSCQTCTAANSWNKANLANGTAVGNCGKCQNGAPVADTTKYNSSCQTCTAANSWNKANLANGTAVGNCGKCQNGAPVADTTKYNSSCQTCTAANSWNKANLANGTPVGNCGKCQNGASVADTTKYNTDCQSCNQTNWTVTTDNSKYNPTTRQCCPSDTPIYATEAGKCCPSARVYDNNKKCCNQDLINGVCPGTSQCVFGNRIYDDASDVEECGTCDKGTIKWISEKKVPKTCQTCDTKTWKWVGHTGLVNDCGICDGVTNAAGSSILLDTSRWPNDTVCENCNKLTGWKKMIDPSKQNQITKACCPDDKPWWYTTMKQCVECYEDAHCANRTDGKTICDRNTVSCTSCPYSVGQTIFESATPNTYYLKLCPGAYDIVIVGAGGGNRGIREKHNHNSGTGASGGSGAGFVGTIAVTKAKNNVAIHVGKGGKYKFTDQCCVDEKATDGEASSISGIISCPGGMAGSVQSDYNQATAGAGGSACTISANVVSSLIKKAGSTGHTGSAKKSGNLTAVSGTTSVVSNFVPNNNGGTPGFCAGWWMNGMYKAGQYSCGSGLTNTSMTDSPSGYVKIIYKGN